MELFTSRERHQLTTRRRQPAAVTDPGSFATSGQWLPIAIGIVTALVVSLTKTAVRPAANVVAAGVAAPVLSTFEDVTSIGLVFVAILLPVLVLVVIALVGWAAFKLWRRRRRQRQAQRAADGGAAPRMSSARRRAGIVDQAVWAGGHKRAAAATPVAVVPTPVARSQVSSCIRCMSTPNS